DYLAGDLTTGIVDERHRLTSTNLAARSHGAPLRDPPRRSPRSPHRSPPPAAATRPPHWRTPRNNAEPAPTASHDRRWPPGSAPNPASETARGRAAARDPRDGGASSQATPSTPPTPAPNCVPPPP